MEINLDDFLYDLSFVDPKYKNEIEAIQEKYNCFISCDTEKHNALQLTYFFEVNFDKDEMFYVEIESGINNGTKINNAEWGYSTKSYTKTARVLKDIILDKDYPEYKANDFYIIKSQAVLDCHKKTLFEYHRKNNYDNYVTGGNSKLKLEPEFLNNLHLEYIYEEIEVDANFV